MDKVYVSIVGESTVNGESEKHEFVTEGDYVMRGGKYMLRYKEGLFEGGQTSSTIVKLDKQSVTITRSGECNTQMIFENGKKHTSHYETPVGSFTMGVVTNSLNVDVGEHGGLVSIRYVLDINNDMQSENNLRLSIRKSS